MVDNRLIKVGEPTVKFLKKNGLSWFSDPVNEEYFAPEVIELAKAEVRRFQNQSVDLYNKTIEAGTYIAKNDLWQEAGIPENAIDLIGYSLKNEQHLHLVGRFDFAGGLDGPTIKMLEFNADTCSLMPETETVQTWQLKQLPKKWKARQYNSLLPMLTSTFEKILQRYPDKNPSLLLSGLGHEEDWLNIEVVAKAAKMAGFKDIQQTVLEKVIFAPEEGIFVELQKDHFAQYDFWYKMIPWDFIAYEEPELMDVLTTIVKNDLAVVMNPAFTMLTQSKALMKYMYDLFPDHEAILKTTFSASDFQGNNYVKKPIYGRTGDNVSLYLGQQRPAAANAGDYGNYPFVYQQYAELDTDMDGDIYQPSMFWSGQPCAICFRRQDALIVDDDAEFVGHAMVWDETD